MQPIAPTEIRYIKLGAGGVFAPVCLERGEIHLSYREVPHDLCLAGDWDRVVHWFVQDGRNIGKARDAMREIRDFYTLGTDCLWITFADGYLWWAFSEPQIIWRGTDNPLFGPRSRSTIGPWRNTSIAGLPLQTQSLTSKLTQVGSYRQTICRVGHDAYLMRKINDVPEPIVAEAEAARKKLIDVAARMISDLHWADFEVLADLIFARGGWQRVSVLGETMADIDLIIEQPTLGERATVQVKSRASQTVLQDHIRHFQRSGEKRTFFICHSPDGKLSTEHAQGVHLWTGDELASVAVKSGLFEWLMDRVG